MDESLLDMLHDYMEDKEVGTTSKKRLVTHIIENLLLNILVAKFLSDKEVDSVIDVLNICFPNDKKIVDEIASALKITIKNVREKGFDGIIKEVREKNK